MTWMPGCLTAAGGGGCVKGMLCLYNYRHAITCKSYHLESCCRIVLALTTTAVAAAGITTLSATMHAARSATILAWFLTWLWITTPEPRLPSASAAAALTTASLLCKQILEEGKGQGQSLRT